MSRFLKFIVHLVVFLLIVCILALAIPPFAGISTVAIDSTDWETNLPLGSVTYGKEISASSVLVGDSVIVQDGNRIYLYGVQEIDLDNSTFTVVDTRAKDGEPKAMTLRGEVVRVFATVWFIGYLLIAIQSKEGLIILGLGVLFLVILFILAEIWGRDKELPEEDLEEEESESPEPEKKKKPVEQAAEKRAVDEQALAAEPKSKKQLKKEARERQKAEVARLKQESKERRKEEKRRLKAAKKIARTGGFIEDMEPVEAILGMDGNSPAEQAADQAHEELKKEIGAVAALPPSEEVERIPTAEIPDLKKSPMEENPTEQKETKGEEAKAEDARQGAEESGGKVKIAIPLHTAEELLEKARSQGEAPKVIHDDEAGVVLLDYSSIIGSENVK